ncbi:MAG: hypothetical protein K2X27_26025, partial [Candidatus Obscuribacterales bacterium]|nr:hypothetical protein [Candidatus Obscuribacterales bacterium]
MKKTIKMRAIGAVSSQFQAELLIAPVFEGSFSDERRSAVHGQALCSQAELLSFDGKHGSTMLHVAATPGAAPRTIFAGLGAADKLTGKTLRDALSAAFREGKRLKVQQIAVQLPSLTGTRVTPLEFGRAVGECAGSVDYVMNHQKTEKGGHKAETRFSAVSLLGSEHPDFQQGLKEGYAVARSSNLARDLVTEPAGTMTPSELAKRAQQVADASKGAIKIKFYGKRELKKMGANAFLAVARGSDEKPVLIEMNYEPEGADKDVRLALIGKSVTFDTGGYDLKPAAGMRTMKCDMAGGAATLSAIAAIAALKLPVNVKVVMAATENMVNGKAYKPGDVIHTMAGLSVEVDNTDAEGRLTLADAIEFVKRQ